MRKRPSLHELHLAPRSQYAASSNEINNILVPKIYGLGRGGYRLTFHDKEKEDQLSTKQKYLKTLQNNTALGMIASTGSFLWEVTKNLLYSWPLKELVISCKNIYSGKQRAYNVMKLLGSLAAAVGMVFLGSFLLAEVGLSLSALIYLPGAFLLPSLAGAAAFTLVGMAVGMFAVKAFKNIKNLWKNRNKEELVDELEDIELEKLKENGIANHDTVEELKAYVSSKLQKHAFLNMPNPLNNKHENYKLVEKALAEGNPAYIGGFCAISLQRKTYAIVNLKMSFLIQKIILFKT